MSKEHMEKEMPFAGEQDGWTYLHSQLDRSRPLTFLFGLLLLVVVVRKMFHGVRVRRCLQELSRHITLKKAYTRNVAVYRENNPSNSHKFYCRTSGIVYGRNTPPTKFLSFSSAVNFHRKEQLRSYWIWLCDFEENYSSVLQELDVGVSLGQFTILLWFIRGMYTYMQQIMSPMLSFLSAFPMIQCCPLTFNQFLDHSFPQNTKRYLLLFNRSASQYKTHTHHTH